MNANHDQIEVLSSKRCVRHASISHALTSGVPEAIVRSWVGHVDARIMKTYTHIADRISREAMLKLFPTDGEQQVEKQAPA